MDIKIAFLPFLFLFLLAGCSTESYGETGDGDKSRQEEQLPRDSGETEGRTLLGIDGDCDGVRDDVQRSIAQRYPTDKGKRAALSQWSKSVQMAFESYEDRDPQMLSVAAYEMGKGLDCLYARAEKPQEEIRFIENLMTNTGERSQTYSEINRWLSGQFLGGSYDPEEACDL